MFMEGEEDIRELTRKGMCINWESALSNKKTNDFQIIKRCMEKIMTLPEKGEAERAAEYFITEVISIREEASDLLNKVKSIVSKVPPMNFEHINIEEVKKIRETANDEERKLAAMYANDIRKSIATIAPFTDKETREKFLNISRIVLTISVTQEELDNTMKEVSALDPEKAMKALFGILETSNKTSRMSLQAMATAEKKIEEFAAKIEVFSNEELVSALAEYQFLLKCTIVSSFYKRGIEV